MMDIIGTLQKFTADLTLQEKKDIKKELSVYLNHLLLNDFSALVQVLYQVDVSEQKLKTVLRENTEANAGDLVAELIIERKLQKQQLRDYLPPPEDISDEERW